MKKKIIVKGIALMLLLLTAININAEELKVTNNHPPIIQSCKYNNTEIVVICHDYDGDCIRCGVDWDIDKNIDEWTAYCECGIEICIDCENRMGAAEVIAEDIHGARSDIFWIRVDDNIQKNRVINTPLLRFLETHPRLFSIIKQILRI